ncbi:MAG: class I SAM-dependent methyltransferase [Actinobacteria bacterium]|nr:class I SAM-dependent methyltransferase [Actinomycetota bacterium]
MAAGLLSSSPKVKMVVSDFDPKMITKARSVLQTFGGRVILEHADATVLPFEDNRFDQVLSFIMLHHVIRWERALFLPT